MVKIFIVDSPLKNILSDRENLVILWNSYQRYDENYISIPQYIDENSEALRSKYLDWIENLGDLIIGGNSLENHLLNNNLSLWWLSLLQEKNVFSKSIEITNAIKTLATLEILKNYSFKEITLYSNNLLLKEVISGFAKNNGIKLSIQKNLFFTIREPFEKIANSKYSFIFKGFIWLLRYAFTRYPLKGLGVDSWINTKGKITIVNYTQNLENQSKESQKFKSKYWSSLPNKLIEMKQDINWLNMYIKDKNLPTSFVAKKKFKKYNFEKNHNHIFLDSFISIRLINRVFLKWIRFVFKVHPINVSKILPSIDNVNFYPFISIDWNNSFFGPSLVSNILYLELFNKAFKSLPKQSLLIYLYENISWEKAMIYSWKKYKHEQVIAYAHSSIRFWDLRYFHSPNFYNRTNVKEYSPSLIGVNGNLAKRSLLKGGCPRKMIIEVEALRYKYLNFIDRRPFNKNCNLNSKNIKILFIGDYVNSNNKYMLHLLKKLLSKKQFYNHEIIIKPHPSTPISEKYILGLNFKFSEKNLDILSSNVDLAIASSLTTASIDINYLGLPILIILNGATLNMTPVIENERSIYIKTFEDLLSAVNYFSYTRVTKSLSDTIFFLDPSLDKWIKFIKNNL